MMKSMNKLGLYVPPAMRSAKDIDAEAAKDATETPKPTSEGHGDHPGPPPPPPLDDESALDDGTADDDDDFAHATPTVCPSAAPPGDTLLAGEPGDAGAASASPASKMLLVFGCIGTDLCKQIRVLQHFSKSTRLST